MAEISKRNVIKRAKNAYYAQERAIEVIAEHPEKSRKEQAAIMGITVSAFRKITEAPEFDAIRQQRMSQIIDPMLKESLEQGLLATSLKAVNIVNERLDVEPTIHDALSTLKVTTAALGMANRKAEAPQIQNTIQIAWLPAQPKPT